MDGVVITMAASRFGALGRSFVDAQIGIWFSTPHLVLLHQTEGDRGFLTQTLEMLCQELVQGGLFHTDLVEVHLRTAILMAARPHSSRSPGKQRRC